MTVNILRQWLQEAIALAQKHDKLWLRIHFDGTFAATITAITPFEDTDAVPAIVDRGCLRMLHGLWLCGGDSLYRVAVKDQRDADPVDGVPWEIHGIEDPVAYNAARQAFIAACHDLPP